VVNRVRLTSIRRPRVYTVWTIWLVALLAAGAGAQPAPETAADPGMVKGPATAPVTIVEFSDYQ